LYPRLETDGEEPGDVGRARSRLCAAAATYGCGCVRLWPRMAAA